MDFEVRGDGYGLGDDVLDGAVVDLDLARETSVSQEMRTMVYLGIEVKSALRAMGAVEERARKRWGFVWWLTLKISEF